MKRTFCLGLTVLLLLLSACAGSGAQTAPSQAPLTWQEQYDLGMKYLSEGNYEEAVLTFTSAIDIDPMRPESYDKLADAYWAIGESDKAIKILQQGYEATEDASLLKKKEDLQKKSLLSTADGTAVQGLGWKNVPQEYFEVCEAVLKLYHGATALELADYVREHLSGPIRAGAQEENTTYYYGEVNKTGMPQGMGLCIYTNTQTEAYVGTFEQGQREGTGVAVYFWSDPEMSCCYSGGWREDSVDGAGEEYITIDDDNTSCSRGTSIMGVAEGYWLECWYENGQYPMEDGDKSNGTTIAGYRFFCENGRAISLGPVTDECWWFGYSGTYGITEPAGDIMAESFVVYADGTELFDPAPHEHAGMGCSECARLRAAGESLGFHAFQEGLSRNYGFYLP